jgi:hypothetical protein
MRLTLKEKSPKRQGTALADILRLPEVWPAGVIQALTRLLIMEKIGF